MKKLLLILCLSLYTYISSAQESSKIGYFQGLTYYHEQLLINQDTTLEEQEIVYYPEEKQVDTVYIIEKVVIEKPIRPRVTIHFGWNSFYNPWHYGYYGYYPYYYSYWRYPHHRYYGYYGWNHYGHNYHHNYYASWTKKKPDNYKVRSNQRSTNISQIRKPKTSNSERRIKQSIYEQKTRNTSYIKTRDYDPMYPSSRIKATKSTRTRYIAPQNKPTSSSYDKKMNSYKRNTYQKSNSNTYKSRSYTNNNKSTPTRSKSYSSPSRSKSYSSPSRSSSFNSSSKSSGSSGTRSSSGSRGRRQ